MRNKFRFCTVKGDSKKARLLERVYDDLDGGVKDNAMLSREYVWGHYSPAKDMFEAGPFWSKPYDTRQDTPGFFVGYTGWFPYFNPFLRRVCRNTLLSICKKQTEEGIFPICVDGEIKTDTPVELNKSTIKEVNKSVLKILKEGQLEIQDDIDVYIDGHLAAIINFCEDILYTRDIKFARKMLPRLRKAMNYAVNRKFKDGLMKVGYGGSFIEMWYSYEGYPSSSQIFYIRSLELMAEVEKYLGNEDNFERYLSYIPEVKNSLIKKLLTREGFFMGALDIHGKRHGDGKDYFESIPNVIAAPIEVVGESIARRIVKKIKTIPQLDSEVPIAVNYPERWEKIVLWRQMHGVGSHWNGGAWMGFGGFEVWTHLIAKDYEKAERLITQLCDYRETYGLQDFVPGFGKKKGVDIYGRKPCDHPLHFHHGAFGNTLRGLLGIQVRAEGLEFMPRVFPDVKEIDLKEPIYFGDKEIYVSVKNGKRITKVTVDGKNSGNFTDEKVLLRYNDFSSARTRFRIELG